MIRRKEEEIVEDESWRVRREDLSPGWGLSILKKQEQRGRIVSQRRVRSSLSCKSPLSTTEFQRLSIKEEDEDGTASTTSSSSFGIERAVSSSSLSSVGSSNSSTGEISPDHSNGALSDCYQGPRSSYRRGLSQRRIRGSTATSLEKPDSSITGPSSEHPPVQQHQPKLCQVEEEELFSAVKTRDESTLKSLCNAGISLEIVDRNGMTPLIVACLNGALLEIVRALISLGASIHAYRPGIHAGYPLHHAAKRGHEQVVKLLLSSGAEASAVNDDGQTALDIARVRGHAPVVRIIEDWVSLFKGVLRQITDATGSQIIKKVWAVVLPSEASRQELVLYSSRKVTVPESVILLGSVTSEVEQPDYASSDPSLVITDRVTKTRFKFFAHEHGDRKQISDFYTACKGFPQEKKQSETVEQTLQKRSCDPVSTTNRPSRDVPPFPRSRSDKPNSRKNIIYPEESL